MEFQSPNNIASLLKKDTLVSPNKFTVTFTRLPKFFSAIDRELLKNLTITTYQINLPSLDIVGDTYLTYGGLPPIEIPKKRRQQEISMVIYLTTSFAQRNFIEYWLYKISDFETNNVNYFNDITGELKVCIYNQLGDIVYDIDFLNVYPAGIETLRLTWLISDEWGEQYVNFRYETFRVNKTQFSKEFFQHFGKTY